MNLSQVEWARVFRVKDEAAGHLRTVLFSIDVDEDDGYSVSATMYGDEDVRAKLTFEDIHGGVCPDIETAFGIFNEVASQERAEAIMKSFVSMSVFYNKEGK